MSTWKSKKVIFSEDMCDNYLDCEGSWEYQTTADVFTYRKIAAALYNGYGIIYNEGDVMESLTMSPEMAVNLYHALSNWMKIYNSEKQMMDAVTDNKFEKENYEN